MIEVSSQEYWDLLGRYDCLWRHWTPFQLGRPFGAWQYCIGIPLQRVGEIIDVILYNERVDGERSQREREEAAKKREEERTKKIAQSGLEWWSPAAYSRADDRPSHSNAPGYAGHCYALDVGRRSPCLWEERARYFPYYRR